MPVQKELSDQNFRRISWINIFLIPPLMILFAWPWSILGIWLEFTEVLLYIGMFCFAFPFSLTILHGHVTIALGALHRNKYYEWLKNHRWSYGFLIRPFFFSTRFRLSLLFFSFGILLTGVML